MPCCAGSNWWSNGCAHSPNHHGQDQPSAGEAGDLRNSLLCRYRTHGRTRVRANMPASGWIGKNTCILNQKVGSWLFLGVILTSIELEPDLPAPDRCGTCTRCIDACPTDALIAPYDLDSNTLHFVSDHRKTRRDSRELCAREWDGRCLAATFARMSALGTARLRSRPQPEFQPREGLVNPALAWLAEISARRVSREVPRLSHAPRQAERTAAQCRRSPWAIAETEALCPRSRS